MNSIKEYLSSLVLSYMERHGVPPDHIEYDNERLFFVVEDHLCPDMPKEKLSFWEKIEGFDGFENYKKTNLNIKLASDCAPMYIFFGKKKYITLKAMLIGNILYAEAISPLQLSPCKIHVFKSYPKEFIELLVSKINEEEWHSIEKEQYWSSNLNLKKDEK